MALDVDLQQCDSIALNAVSASHCSVQKKMIRCGVTCSDCLEFMPFLVHGMGMNGMGGMNGMDMGMGPEVDAWQAEGQGHIQRIT